MQEHEIAAHRVADCLRTIAHLMPQLTPAALEAYVPGLSRMQEAMRNGEYAAHLTRQADRIEATVPFEPITESQTQAIWENYVCMAGDMSTRETVEAVTGNLFETPWKLRAEFDDMLDSLDTDEDTEERERLLALP